MSFHPRRRRPDDWKTSHARARADLSDRLDAVLDPGEAGWLDEHLVGCADCRTAAAEYAADREALRSLRDVRPMPPRDLWARTAATIEHESRFRDRAAVGRARRPLLASTVLAAALVVVVAAGVLTSSRLLVGGDHATPSSGSNVAAASGAEASDVAAATSIPISQKVHWIGRTADGRYAYKTMEVREVCPNGSDPCEPGAPTQDQPVQISDPQSVIGSPEGGSIIVIGEGPEPSSNSVTVVRIPPSESGPPSASESPAAASTSPEVTATPNATPIRTATPLPTSSAPSSLAPSVAPSAPASAPPSTSSSAATASVAPTQSTAPTAPSKPSPSIEPTPSAVTITPSPSAPDAIEIANDVVLVGQSAAYSPSGDWFAFTARPTDGSSGPDIYVWKVGEPTARPVTTDHESTFGSWIGDDIVVGSSVVDVARGSTSSPAASSAESPAGQRPAASATAGERASVSFLLDPRDGTQIALPQTGRTWRPSVDPTGRRAVYWTGTLRRSGGAPADVPDAGRLVVGDWATGDAAPSGSPAATAPHDQASDRHESTISDGPIPDWDARWDPSGTKLAVWIADANDPRVGTLSLYDVATFDAQVDLKKPLLDSRPATAGFSISNGKLVWAEPAADGSGDKDRILVLAWTDHGVGTVQTQPDEGVVVR